MVTNTDLTLYHYNKGTYTRFYIEKASWYESRGNNLSTDGASETDTLAVRVPDVSEFVPNSEYDGEGWTVKNGDLICKGSGPDSITKATDLAKVTPYFKVSAWADNRRGTLQHIRIEAV